MILAPVLKQRFFDSNGSPLAGGKLYTYEAGTTTPLGTYSDAAGAANANPVILDASGEANVWLDSASSYKFVLKNSTDVTQYTIDTVTTAGSVGTASIVDDAVTLAKIADDAVGADQLKDSVGTDLDRAVTTNHIRDVAVTTAKIANDSVTADKLKDSAATDADRAVTTDHIRDSAVTTAKIADLAVTQVKLAARATGTTVAAGGVAVSASSGSFDVTSSTYTDVTGVSVTITTTGRPVAITLRRDPSQAPSTFLAYFANSSSTDTTSVMFVRDTTSLGALSGSSGKSLPPGAYSTIDVVAAGTYTYKLQIASSNAATTAQARYCQLVAYEL